MYKSDNIQTPNILIIPSAPPEDRSPFLLLEIQWAA